MSPAPAELLSKLLWIREAAALPDQALADLLGVGAPSLDALVQAHPERFADEMVFRLTGDERARIPEAPVLAFTEAGVALLVGLLGKDAELLALLPRFAEARHLLSSQAELAARVGALEEKLEMLAQALQRETPEVERHRPMGFVAEGSLPPHLKEKERQDRGRAQE